jgi:nucleoside-diphosphate-sugar epimerase
LTDLSASLLLLERARAWGCLRFVGVGTCLEYATDRGYLSEDVPLVPLCLYESSKASLYLTSAAWARNTGASLAWARLFYQFGPGEDLRRLVPSVVTALLANRPVAVTTGLQVRDYLHVDDVAAAIAQLAISDATGPFNVGSGRPVRVRDLVSELEHQIGRPGLILYGELPDTDDPPFICANSRRLRAATGWQPSRTLEAGLAETIAWWTERRATLGSGGQP